MGSQVVVRALAPPPSITLQVSGVSLNRTFWTSRDNWEAFTATLNDPTRKLAQALWTFHGIGKIQIAGDNVVRIKADCNYNSIVEAILYALDADFVEFVPPAPRRLRDLISRP